MYTKALSHFIYTWYIRVLFSKRRIKYTFNNTSVDKILISKSLHRSIFFKRFENADVKKI